MVVVDYAILSAPSPHFLENAIRVSLPKGWEPIGGVAVSITNYGAIKFYQAMVKKDYAWPEMEDVIAVDDSCPAVVQDT